MATGVLYDECRKYIAHHMFERAAYIAVGDGGHNATDLKPKAVDPTRMGLFHEIMRKPLREKVQEDLFSITGSIRVEKTELNGAYISEYLLLDVEGKPIGGKTSAPKIKESDEYYDFSVKVKF